jgi:NAD(P)-dependent dehydrogenase (short-subunit alcohol dehydrogenase family)
VDLGPNSVALIAGGTSKIGLSTARMLLKGGSPVVLLTDDPKKAQELCGEWPGAAVVVPGEPAEASAVDAAIAQAQRLGPIRVALNCSAISHAERLVSRDGSCHPVQPLKDMLAYNVIGSFNLLRLAAAAMSREEPNADGERGVIILSASIAAFEGQVGQVAYAASKGAIVAMALPAARDLAVLGVRVCVIAPGAVDNDHIDALPEATLQEFAQHFQFPARFASGEEFAHLVAALVGNQYMNGSVIRFDGALRMPPR